MSATAATSARARVPVISPSAVAAVYAVVLLALPQNNVITGTGAAITPARLVAGGCVLWWVTARLSGHLGLSQRPSVVRSVMLGYLLVLGVTHALALLNGVPDAVLQNSDRAVMLLILAAGAALLVCDGVRTIGGLSTVFAAVIVSVTASSVAALIEFSTGAELRALTVVPGLSSQDIGYVYADRGGFVRTFGLTNHPVELAGLCAAALPLALHLERFARRPTLWRVCSALLVAGPVVSISRTGLLGIAVASLALLPRSGWSRWAGGVMAATVVALGLAILDSRLMRVLANTIAMAGGDLSITSRVNDYDYVSAHIAQHPVSGQGFGTYVVPPQPYLDNQYLFTIVESGIPGLLALFALLGVPMLLMYRLWRRSGPGPAAAAVVLSDRLRDACWSVGTGLLTCVVCFVAFDALSFPQFLGLSLLLVGLAGAVRGTAATAQEPGVRR